MVLLYVLVASNCSRKSMPHQKVYINIMKQVQ
jgi:hypothetical protein